MPFGKELLIDVFEAYFYKDNKMVFMSKNMTSTGISNSQSESEVRNGAGNGLYAVLSGQKEVTVSLTENVFSFEMIAMQTGSPIVTGAGVGITSSITGRAESDKTFAIPETPKSGEVLNVYDGENKLPSSAFTVSGKKITFTTAPSNEIFVEPYRFNTNARSQTITIAAHTFA